VTSVTNVRFGSIWFDLLTVSARPPTHGVTVKTKNGRTVIGRQKALESVRKCKKTPEDDKKRKAVFRRVESSEDYGP
jgi:hypothetical protein